MEGLPPSTSRHFQRNPVAGHQKRGSGPPNVTNLLRQTHTGDHLEATPGLNLTTTVRTPSVNTFFGEISQ